MPGSVSVWLCGCSSVVEERLSVDHLLVSISSFSKMNVRKHIGGVFEMSCVSQQSPWDRPPLPASQSSDLLCTETVTWFMSSMEIDLMTFMLLAPCSEHSSPSPCSILLLFYKSHLLFYHLVFSCKYFWTSFLKWVSSTFIFIIILYLFFSWCFIFSLILQFLVSFYFLFSVMCP